MTSTTDKSLCCWNTGCDAAGIVQCGGCRIAKYCGKDCQLNDWKHGGHRAMCKALKAAIVLMDAESNDSEKWSAFNGKELDNHYDIVIKHFPSSFWAAVRGLVVDDLENFRSRIRSGTNLCWLSAIYSFCHGVVKSGTTRFTGLNTNRFLRFMDEEGAWENTLRVTLTSLQFSIESQCRSQGIQQVTMSCLRALNDACCSKDVSERVLTVHMEITATLLREMWLVVRDQEATGSDPSSTMESLVYQVISILDLWDERIGVSCDEEGLKFIDRVGILNGSSFHKSLYSMAKSFANAQIRKIDPDNWS